MPGNLSRDSDGEIYINGGTDGTLIGNTSNRLLVDAGTVSTSLSPIPSQRVMYSKTFCTNAGSSAANVNGSVTPVNFDFTPAAGETWYLEVATIFFADSGTTSIGNFGALAAITNGIDFRIRSNGTEYLVNNFKTNWEVTQVFPDFTYQVPTSGFLESSDTFVSGCVFRVPITLQNSTSDYVRFRIRDNLTAIDHLRFMVHAWRVI